MAIAKTLCARAGAVAALLLLALPSLAAANPGKGPTLVRRSGQFVIVHADGRDGRSTRQAVLRDGLTRTPVRAPADAKGTYSHFPFAIAWTNGKRVIRSFLPQGYRVDWWVSNNSPLDN